MAVQHSGTNCHTSVSLSSIMIDVYEESLSCSLNCLVTGGGRGAANVSIVDSAGTLLDSDDGPSMDNIVNLYKSTVTSIREIQRKNGKEIWMNFQNQLPVLKSLLEKALPRSKRAGFRMRARAGIGMGTDYEIEAVKGADGTEIEQARTVSAVLWKKCHSEYISLSRRLQKVIVIAEPWSIDTKATYFKIMLDDLIALKELIVLAVRMKHGDGINWLSRKEFEADNKRLSDQHRKELDDKPLANLLDGGSAGAAESAGMGGCGGDGGGSGAAGAVALINSGPISGPIPGTRTGRKRRGGHQMADNSMAPGAAGSAGMGGCGGDGGGSGAAGAVAPSVEHTKKRQKAASPANHASRATNEIKSNSAKAGENGAALSGICFDVLKFEHRCKTDGTLVQSWSNVPPRKNCNTKDFHGTITGNLTVSIDMNKHVTVPVNCNVHNTRGDGSCGLYALLQTAEDTTRSPVCWARLLERGVTSPSIKILTDTLSLMADMNNESKRDSNTDGCPRFRKSMWLFMLENRLRLAEKYAHAFTDPPERASLNRGKALAETYGRRMSDTADLYEQHAVALLDPNLFFDDHYLGILKAYLGGAVAFATIQNQLVRYDSEPVQGKNTRTSKPDPARERQHIHFRDMIEEGDENTKIVWPMYLSQEEQSEDSEKSHYHALRSRDPNEPTSLCFLGELRGQGHKVLIKLSLLSKPYK